MAAQGEGAIDVVGGGWGPETRRRLARLALIYAGLYGVGLFLAQFAATPGWQAFGLGLMLPGGGFLAYAWDGTLLAALHAVLAFIAFLAFGLAMFLWFATGNVVAPPAVWLLAALAALAMDHPILCSASAAGDAFEVLPLVVAGAVLGGCGLGWGIRAAQRRARRENARYVDAHRQAHVEAVRSGSGGSDRELSETEIARLRFLLDRALQPVEAFDGFQWIEQFQTAAVRYQLCFSGYALSLAQVHCLPAFRGYLAKAQRNLIEKQRDHRIWRYWRAENLWGNLRSDPDPIPRDNIMYTGFVGAQIAYYQAATGDRRYARPGAFTLTHPDGREFRHDFGSMVAALQAGWACSPYTAMPCEPNWVYPLCNGIGATAVLAHDRQSGHDAWAAIAPGFREELHRELTTPAGRLVPFRSTYTGIAAPQIGGAVADAFPCLFYNAVLPDEAVRLWLLARRDMLRPDGSLDRRRFWPIDTGDYRFARATSYAGVAAAAVEMGDVQIAALALDALDRECPGRSAGGVIHRDNASVWAHAVELIARFGRTNGIADLVGAPVNSHQGPVIDTDAYPDYLVAKAVRQDGRLEAVLYPGRGARTLGLTLSGFDPGAPFSCQGCATGSGAADDRGRAEITVRLDGRSELVVAY